MSFLKGGPGLFSRNLKTFHYKSVYLIRFRLTGLLSYLAMFSEYGDYMLIRCAGQVLSNYKMSNLERYLLS
jgi:hypothetical protein